MSDTAAGGASRPTRGTLLLVDDEENILSSLRRLLRGDGYQIVTATSGAQGLEILASRPVDVVLSDQRMPGMMGVEFLRRAKGLYPDTVRMVLSGYTELQSVTDAINEGAIYKFLTKPWDDAMLRANIDEAFRRKGLVDENRRLAQELKAANDALARVNQRLQWVLEQQAHRIDVGEHTLSLAQEAMDRLPLPVLGVDPEGMIAFANRAAERFFATESTLVGVPADDYLPPPLLDRVLGAPPAGPLPAVRGRQVELGTLGPPRAPRGYLITLLPGAAP